MLKAEEPAVGSSLRPEIASGTFVVIPAFNEEAVIRTTVEGVLRLGGVHVVVVDDCSTDATGAKLEALPISVLRHGINLGQGACLQTGIEYALGRGARYLVTFDADGQHDPEDIPRLLRTLTDRELDIVLGSRFLGRAIGLSLSRKILLKAAVWYTRIATGLPVTDAHNGLRAFRAGAAPRLRITQNRMAHASEFPVNIRRHRLAWAEVPVSIRYSPYSRAKGQTGLGVVDILFEMTIRRLMR